MKQFKWMLAVLVAFGTMVSADELTDQIEIMEKRANRMKTLFSDRATSEALQRYYLILKALQTIKPVKTLVAKPIVAKIKKDNPSYTDAQVSKAFKEARDKRSIRIASRAKDLIEVLKQYRRLVNENDLRVQDPTARIFKKLYYLADLGTSVKNQYTEEDLKKFNKEVPEVRKMLAVQIKDLNRFADKYYEINDVTPNKHRRAGRHPVFGQETPIGELDKSKMKPEHWDAFHTFEDLKGTTAFQTYLEKHNLLEWPSANDVDDYSRFPELQPFSGETAKGDFVTVSGQTEGDFASKSATFGEIEAQLQAANARHLVCPTVSDITAARAKLAASLGMVKRAHMAAKDTLAKAPGVRIALENKLNIAKSDEMNRHRVTSKAALMESFKKLVKVDSNWGLGENGKKFTWKGTEYELKEAVVKRLANSVLIENVLSLSKPIKHEGRFKPSSYTDYSNSYIEDVNNFEANPFLFADFSELKSVVETAADENVELAVIVDPDHKGEFATLDKVHAKSHEINDRHNGIMKAAIAKEEARVAKVKAAFEATGKQIASLNGQIATYNRCFGLRKAGNDRIRGMKQLNPKTGEHAEEATKSYDEVIKAIGKRK